MSWASRRRFLYITGILLFFGVLIGVPTVMWLHRPATCEDGVMNGAETDVDKGGPCPLLDERFLNPHAILWTRAFPVRDGTYNVLAYIENPNESAGVLEAPYQFRLYDSRNVLIAERDGVAFIMPGTITPILEGAVDTGNRVVARAFFEFTAPLVWKRMVDTSRPIVVLSKNISDSTTLPRLTAVVENTSVADLRDVEFVAAVYDTVGNVFAASGTAVPLLAAGSRETVTFTWPDPFEYLPSRIDVLPLTKPEERR